MALYEYICESCKNGKPFRFELRMPMKDAVQLAPCPQCNKKAKKVFGSFAVTGVAAESIGDGPAPWDDEGGLGDDDPMGGHGHSHDHGHSHGHSHGGMDDLDFDDDF